MRLAPIPTPTPKSEVQALSEALLHPSVLAIGRIECELFAARYKFPLTVRFEGLGLEHDKQYIVKQYEDAGYTVKLHESRSSQYWTVTIS